MRSAASLRHFVGIILPIAWTIAAVACQTSHNVQLAIVATPKATSTPTATATSTPPPTSTPSPTPTPAPASFSLTPGQMAAMGRASYALAVLASGKVLIAGGMDIFTNVLSTAEVFDPSTGNFTFTGGPMPGPRWEFTATLLNNGQVLVAGGIDNNKNYLDTAALYDPVSDSFTVLASQLSVPRSQHRATLLNDGTVLITGGFTTPLPGKPPLPVASAEVFNPADDSFNSVGPMADARALHTATLLANGDVLVTGGASVEIPQLASAELYNPVTRGFTPAAGSMAHARQGAVAALVTDGRVLVAGGGNSTSGALKSAELYSVATGTFTSTSNGMPEPHYLPAIASLSDGGVLIAGGFAGSGDSFNLNAQTAATVFQSFGQHLYRGYPP